MNLVKSLTLIEIFAPHIAQREEAQTIAARRNIFHPFDDENVQIVASLTHDEFFCLH